MWRRPIANDPAESRRALALLGVRIGTSDSLVETLPFSVGDATAGAENELQAVVVGRRADVDLPRTIRRSNYYANLIKRAAAGDTPQRAITNLQRYLDQNFQSVWENSWVRLPARALCPFARESLEGDLLADKQDPGRGRRSDVGRFFVQRAGEEWIRVPISYLVKLSLADALGSQDRLPGFVFQAGRSLLDNFSNDNTSPETRSFHPIASRPGRRLGADLARETGKRFLLTQLVIMYANAKLSLAEGGQRAMISFAPHPPIRQKELNDYVSDAFYRELFMSPCLSGWDDGEAKQHYMHLCHQALSRSQLNALGKLREAGIITTNLVVLPNTSNISLANNGTHVSLGSRRLSAARRDAASGFGPAQEKLVGDLAIKIVEHFLPLFVGTYSAAPYRLDFSDFHPERVLGFLPHELDDTHLRMLWRRWRRKACLKVLGQPLTPFGPKGLDRALGAALRLRGDLVPDFRLIDYLVAVLSTDESPALDGRIGNATRLKRDLADLGVIDARMALYLPYRLREFASAGFAGFEGRHYSLFEGLERDLGAAADLQRLVTALALKYLAQARFSHAHIPDDPWVESERRQIFFGAAIGVPTFFVRADTDNIFLRRIVRRTAGVRPSRRYPGYLRVQNLEYRRALLQILREDAADLVEALGLEEVLADLAARLDQPEGNAVADRLTRDILREAGSSSALRLDARRFNEAAERYYRERLRRRHLEEAFRFLEQDVWSLDPGGPDGARLAEGMRFVLHDQHPSKFLAACKDELEERAPVTLLQRLITLLVISLHRDIGEAEALLGAPDRDVDRPAPVRRTA